MVPELRKRHRMIWMLWAVLLPIGFVLAIRSLPQKGYSPELTGIPMGKAPKTVASARDGNVLAALHAGPDGRVKQLELRLLEPLASGPAALYWQKAYLGRLGSKGTYRFVLDSTMTSASPFQLEIRDPIRNKPLHQITF